MKNSMFGFSAGGYLSTKPMPADSDLLQRYADDHSEDAFAELVRRHLDSVYSSALRRVGFDTHLAQDVAQAVFVALARQSRALVAHPFLTAWLYATTRNEAANTVRRERRRKTREAAATAMNETNDSSSAESAADWSRLSPILDDAIDQLSETDRAAILLRFIDRRPFAEIGANLRVTEDAARMRVDRALDKLRTLLTRRGITSTSAALGLVLANNAVAAAPISVATSVTLAAIGTIPATTTAGVASAKIGTSAALSAKAYVGIATITAASLGYFVFAINSANAPLPAQTSAIVPVSSKTSPRVWPAEETTARAFLEDHPEVKKALAAYYRAHFKTLYAHIYRTLSLSESEINDLQNLLAEGLNFSSTFFPDLKLPAGAGIPVDEANARIEALLGPARYPEWKSQQRDFFDRKYTEDIALALAFTDAALDSSTTGLLLNFIKAHRRAEDWNAVIADAQKFLSPPQTQAFNRAFVSILIDFPDHLFPDRLRPKTLPDPQTVQLERRRGRIISEYAPFYEIARLSPSQRTDFEQILLDEQAAISRQSTTFRPQQTESRQAELLGAEGFQKLKNFRRAQFAYTLTGDFAAHAAISGHALTRQQCEHLVQTLIACASNAAGWIDPSTIDWRRSDELSKEFLTPAQLDLFQTTEQRAGISRPQLELEKAIRTAINMGVYDPLSPPASRKPVNGK
jgi:RNA polymerase sigma factor (sigma-70 family)